MRTRRAPAPAPCAWPPALSPRGWNGSLRRQCFPPSVRPAASLGVSAPRRRLPAPRAGSSPLPPRPRCVRPAAVAPVRASLFSPPPSCSACDRTPLQPSHTLSASSTHFSLFCLNLKSFWPPFPPWPSSRGVRVSPRPAPPRSRRTVQGSRARLAAQEGWGADLGHRFNGRDSGPACAALPGGAAATALSIGDRAPPSI